MRLSDIIADHLKSIGVEHVFCLTGGASLHLIHSINNSDINCLPMQHEQAAAMAADGYSRIGDQIGVAVVTSGPGATNLITGIAGAFYDSVPCLFITGQVATFRSKQDTGVRQLGFQETDIIDICKTITKYQVKITDPKQIKYELQKAISIAKSGRPGPVLIDIPDNLQRIDLEEAQLEQFLPESETSNNDLNVDLCLNELYKAKRPMIVLGVGVKLAHAHKEVNKLINQLKIPFVPTWGAADLIDNKNQYYCGTFGTHGIRSANFAVQNSDLILSIGSRLDTKATGHPSSTFAREAKKIMVDIDQNEIDKFINTDMKIDVGICCDAKKFITKLSYSVDNTKLPKIDTWINQIGQWKQKYPIVQSDSCDAYNLFDKLSQTCQENDNIILDTGCVLAWAMQAFRCKRNQNLVHDWNNTAMGWALPASIGAYLANKNRTLCISGDGSMQMNIQELATIHRNQFPIKIIVLNNNGHSMIKQTQDQWLNSNYISSSVEGGLPSIRFSKVAQGYQIPSYTMSLDRELLDFLQQFLNYDGQQLLEISVNPDDRVKTQVKFGRPLEDLEPLLPRDELSSNMIIQEI